MSTPLLELGGSVILGGVLGVIFAFLAKKAGDTDELLIMSLAMILVAAGGAYLLGLSPLVANIVLGLMLANLGSGAPRVFFCLNSFTPPIYLLFFTLSLIHI